MRRKRNLDDTTVSMVETFHTITSPYQRQHYRVVLIAPSLQLPPTGRWGNDGRLRKVEIETDDLWKQVQASVQVFVFVMRCVLGVRTHSRLSAPTGKQAAARRHPDLVSSG